MNSTELVSSFLAKRSTSRHWEPEPNTRGTGGLIWSCVLTLLLCIWTTVHPNVPGGRRRWYGTLWVRCSWMLFSLFAPEIVLLMAYKQREMAGWVTAEMPAIEEKFRRETYEEKLKREREKQQALAAIEALRKRANVRKQWRKTLTTVRTATAFVAKGADSVVSTLSPTTTVSSATSEKPEESSTPSDIEKGPAMDKPAATSSEQTDPSGNPIDPQVLAKQRQLLRYKWTITHSYLLTMGGIAFSPYDKSSGAQIIPYTYWATVTIPGAAFINMIDPTVLRIPKRFVEDKSKSSAFFKAYVIFQTGFFILQCIERLVQRLGITPIELNTCMHVICAVLMNTLWWYKPFCVEAPFLIHDEHGLRLGALLHMIDEEGIDLLDTFLPDQVPTQVSTPTPTPESPTPTEEPDAICEVVESPPLSPTVEDEKEIHGRPLMRRRTTRFAMDEDSSGTDCEKGLKSKADVSAEEVSSSEDGDSKGKRHPYGRLLLDSDNRMNDWRIIQMAVAKMSLLKEVTKKLRDKVWARHKDKLSAGPPEHNKERMRELAKMAVLERPEISLEEWKRCYHQLGNLEFGNKQRPESPRIHPDHEIFEYAGAVYSLGGKQRRYLFIDPILIVFTILYGAAHIAYICVEGPVLRSNNEKLVWTIASGLIAGTSLTFWCAFEGLPKLLRGLRKVSKRSFQKVHSGASSTVNLDDPIDDSPGPFKRSSTMKAAMAARAALGRVGTSLSQQTAKSWRSIRSFNFLPKFARRTAQKVYSCILPGIRMVYKAVDAATKRLEDMAKIDLMIGLMLYFTAARIFLVVECFCTIAYLPEKYFLQPNDWFFF